MSEYNPAASSPSLRYKHSAKYLLNRSRQVSTARGIPFSLTLEWVTKELERGTCAVTGIPFRVEGNKRGPFQPSIDRKDNLQGYTPDNCQLVCLLYNYAKAHFTHEDVVKMAKALVLYE